LALLERAAAATSGRIPYIRVWDYFRLTARIDEAIEDAGAHILLAALTALGAPDT
jgi:hypothetical protein